MAQEYVPVLDDAVNDVLDLQHAHDFAVQEKTPLGFELFYCPFSFCQRVALRRVLVVSLRLLLTLQLSASVSWRWRCILVYAWHCWFHWNVKLLHGFLNHFSLTSRTVSLSAVAVKEYSCLSNDNRPKISERFLGPSLGRLWLAPSYRHFAVQFTAKLFSLDSGSALDGGLNVNAPSRL